jgi:ABC-type dipeptide/oligopeptide/nickel transport system ATPase component
VKKIDLHIHTVQSLSDWDFEFSLDKLEEYVKKLEIDCIAITNHNLFDLEQFNTIVNRLCDIKVLPGIEIDLEGGHLLLISENYEVLDFDIKCKQVQELIKTKQDFITVETLVQIFNDLNRYLLIPHYDKRPIIKEETLNKLKPHISCGEVTSIIKFKSCWIDTTKLTPVIFSDVRIKIDMQEFPIKQTFIDLEEITLTGIKSCLFDKSKVSLSKEDGNNLFLATNDGLYLSTGLNIILGERSSGKSHTLNKICEASENVKYIRQFSLLQDSEENFKKLLSTRNSTVTEDFLIEFKLIVSDILTVDLKRHKSEIEKYLDTLIKFALESDKQDTFARAALFKEVPFPETELNGLQKLIEAVILLIENEVYKVIIENNILVSNLKSLACELIQEYHTRYDINVRKRWLNQLISKIQGDLRSKTSATFPEDIDLYSIIIENEKVKRFDQIVKGIQSEKEISRKELRGFQLVANAKRFANASQLKSVSGGKLAFSDAFNSYGIPYRFLNTLKQINIPETDYYKYFVNIEYKILNKHDSPVSGGERSEFNLLHEINDALKHDLLLIDEPESSFDNLFLKNEVNELIKDISKKIPVIIVTHNSTVGASIKPDYLAYTQKTIVDKLASYKIYTGYPSNKTLKSLTGELIDNYNVLLSCLEAGKEAYDNRKQNTYDILKDRKQ